MNEEKHNKLILDNLTFAREVIGAFPMEKVDLDAFKYETDCGTLYCGLGILANIPKFKEQGLFFEEIGEHINDGICFNVMVKLDGETYDPLINSEEHALDALFGEDAYNNVFSTAGSSPVDEEFGDSYSVFMFNAKANMNDKDRLLKRLTHQIEVY